MGIDAEMFARTKAKISLDELKILRWKIGDTLGPEHFWIFPPNEWASEGRHSLNLVNKIEQDGPDIFPQDGETFIQVAIATRYYGKGYERGDLMLICAVAEWLELHIPDCSVWYGGDSSGVVHEPFGPRERAALKDHFYRVGHEPYQDGFNHFGNELREFKFIPSCPNEGCLGKTIRYGYGDKYNSRLCHSCGRGLWTRNGGETWFSSSVHSNRGMIDENKPDYRIEFSVGKWEKYKKDETPRSTEDNSGQGSDVS